MVIMQKLYVIIIFRSTELESLISYLYLLRGEVTALPNAAILIIILTKDFWISAAKWHVLANISAETSTELCLFGS